MHKNSMPKEINDSLSTLDLNDNNIDGKIAHLRDTFLASEREYIMKLLKDDSIIEMIRDVNWYDSFEIVKKAEEIIFQVENNLIPYEQMNKTEIKLTILLVAIQDKVLVKVLKRYKELEQKIEQWKNKII